MILYSIYIYICIKRQKPNGKIYDNKMWKYVFHFRENCKKVADIFVKKGPFLKMYTAYITDFEETNRVFDDAIKKIPTFQQVVKEFEVKIIRGFKYCLDYDDENLLKIW